ncbi:hypothetical protein [Massilia sp. TS11]|uniref:hypothetical protein n=1 Tax=Massilia sp. TS11 TaxID=2908003 RepID=UPI001EDB7493|nr:hypothetical protein [Massilia sp. TS11]MCG2586802.1 hypothetical protein [Massilia sp. TS11]
MSSTLCRAAFAAACLVSTLPAHAQAWSIKFTDSPAVCISQSLAWRTDSARPGKLQQEYLAAPQAFAPYWKKRTGVFSDYEAIPFADIKAIGAAGVDQVNRGVRLYTATLADGAKVAGDDNFQSLFLCKAGSEKFLNRCIPVHYVKLACIDEKEGTEETVYLNFDHNGNGVRPRDGQVRYPAEIALLSAEQAAPALARFEQAKASLPMRRVAQEALRKEAERREALQRQAAQQEANRERKQVIERSPPGTQMLCESSPDWLVAPGQSLSTVLFRCDLMREPATLRELLDHAWEVSGESRQPVQTMTGATAYQVSLRLKKQR